MAALLAVGPSSPEFGKLKSTAQALMSQKEWNAAALISLGGVLAAEVNRLSGLSGVQKKQLVLDVLKVVLQEAVEKSRDLSGSLLASPEAVASLKFVLDSAVPASLDLAVAAARGQLDLKKVKKTVFYGCLACLPSLVGLCGVSKAQAQTIVSQVQQVAEKVDPSLVEQDSAKAQTETPETKSESQETSPQKNSPEGGVVIRVPEATPPSESQIA